MGPKPADYMPEIRQRAAEYLPEILRFLKACGHPKENEVEDAVVEAAVIYFRLTRPQSNIRKAAMKKIEQHARKFRAALSLENFSEDEREDLHEILDLRLRIHPPGTLRNIFPQSVDGLSAKLDGLIRAFGKGANLKSPAAKTGLCKNCLIVFECFRPGEATRGQKGDFLSFVELVYEVATGVIPFGVTSMSTPVRTTLEEYRTLLAEGAGDVWNSL